jgi:hypothetical protein
MSKLLLAFALLIALAGGVTVATMFDVQPAVAGCGASPC